MSIAIMEQDVELDMARAGDSMICNTTNTQKETGKFLLFHNSLVVTNKMVMLLIDGSKILSRCAELGSWTDRQKLLQFELHSEGHVEQTYAPSFRISKQ